MVWFGKEYPALGEKINLKSSVLITAVKGGEEEYFIMQGQLYDVGFSDLALVISYEDMQELNRMGSNTKLQFLLPLPTQAIELEAVPTKAQRLNESSNKMLLGANISKMSGRDRILFMDFITSH